MALTTLDDTQSGLNIDLIDPNCRALATSLIKGAVVYASEKKGIGFPLKQAEHTTYIEDGASQFVLSIPTPIPKGITPASALVRKPSQT